MQKTKKLLIIFGLLLAFPAFAAEQVDDFTVTIRINQDSSLNVSEEISYNFGDEVKHGIYRDIPYKYEARGGNYNLRLSKIAVFGQNGQPVDFEVSGRGDLKRIKIGDPDKTVSGERYYKINYTVDRAVNYFAEQDELYWNITGHNWEVPIMQAKAKVILPAAVDEEKINTQCFSGTYGSQGRCISQRYEYSGERLVSGLAFIDDRFDPGEGMTIVVGLPKGSIDEQPVLNTIKYILLDNIILFFPLAAFFILFYLWKTKGRDPEGKGTIIAQFEPPRNLTPSEVGVIIDERAHKKDTSAEIINLAVGGYIKIKRLEGKGLLKSDDYELIRLKPAGESESSIERDLMAALFAGNKEKIELSELKNKFYQDLEKLKKQIYKNVVKKKYFLKNPNTVRSRYIALGIVAIIAAWFIGPAFGFLGVASVAVSGLLIFIFGFFMPAKTVKGVLAREHILGLKLYLSVAEKERIKFHNAPEKNPQHFEKLLPYAMVLGVEKEWAKQFEGIYNQSPSWYSDSAGRNFSALTLADNLDSFQGQANSTLSSRPSSASSGGSGFSGGGSGGGFGGGGGGSW